MRIAVLVLGTAILFFACSNNDIDKIQAFLSPDDLPIQEAVNFETLYTDSGQIQFSLKTPKLLRFENGGKTYTEFPLGMELVKFDKHQQIISSIKADYAKQFERESKWEAKNNVIVTNADGDSLKTEHLIWEEKLEKIHTEEFVKIIRKDQVITGLGLTSDQNMANWEIKDVKGILYLDMNKQESKETKVQPLTKSDQNLVTPSQQPLKFN